MFATHFRHSRLLSGLLLCLLLALPYTVQAAPLPSASNHPAQLPSAIELDLWQTITNQAEGFQVEIPLGWETLKLSETTIASGMAIAGETNPKLPAWLNSPAFRQLIAGGMKFYAIDLSERAMRYDLPANVNIIKLEIGGDLPITTIQRLNERQLSSLAAADYPLRSGIVTSNGREAVFFQYVLAYDLGFAQPQLTQINQLLLVENSVQYIVTVGVPLAAADEYLDTVTRILDSFQLLTASDAVGNSQQPPANQVVAVVQTNSLNVRKGPGTGYGIVGHVNRGDQLTVLGQVANCAWLQVQTPEQQTGWVAGTAQYVTLDVACNTISLVKGVVVVNGTPPRQGCILFQNNINDELTITFTSKDGQWNETFKVGRKAHHRHCFAVGEYTFTVDAPPPWASFNDRVTIPPGANIPYPVNPG